MEIRILISTMSSVVVPQGCCCGIVSVLYPRCLVPPVLLTRCACSTCWKVCSCRTRCYVGEPQSCDVSAAWLFLQHPTVVVGVNIALFWGVSRCCIGPRFLCVVKFSLPTRFPGAQGKSETDTRGDARDSKAGPLPGSTSWSVLFYC